MVESTSKSSSQEHSEKLKKHLSTFASQKKSLNELIAIKTPPPAVGKMAEAFAIVFTGTKKAWADMQIIMKTPAFCENLQNYSKIKFEKKQLELVQPYLNLPELKSEKLKTQSQIAVYLMTWLNLFVEFKNTKSAQTLSPAEEIQATLIASVRKIDVSDIAMLKSLKQPPPSIALVFKAVLILKGEQQDFSWTSATNLINDAKQFINFLINYNSSSVTAEMLVALEPIQADKSFDASAVRYSSLACVDLLNWVNAVVALKKLLVSQPASSQPTKSTKQAQEANFQESKVDSSDSDINKLQSCLSNSVGKITKADLVELKCLKNAPPLILLVFKAVLILKGEEKDFTWNNAKIVMMAADFIESLKNYNSRNVTSEMLAALAPIQADKKFDIKEMQKISTACSHLVEWVNAVVQLKKAFEAVPKQATSQSAPTSWPRVPLMNLQQVFGQASQEQKYIFIQDLQGNVPTFMNYQKAILNFEPQVMLVNYQEQTKAEAVEAIRAKMVCSMRAGETLGINLEKCEVDFKEYSSKDFPTEIYLDYVAGRQDENVLKLTKPEERHGLDGVVNGMFFMNAGFQLVLISSATDEKVLQNIVQSLPNQDKWLKVIVV